MVTEGKVIRYTYVSHSLILLGIIDAYYCWFITMILLFFCAISHFILFYEIIKDLMLKNQRLSSKVIIFLLYKSYTCILIQWAVTVRKTIAYYIILSLNFDYKVCIAVWLETEKSIFKQTFPKLVWINNWMHITPSECKLPMILKCYFL